MSLFQEHREQIAQRILDKSIEIFLRNGYEETTISEITQAVGIAKGTFYNFYTSKRDILIHWAAQVFLNLDFREAFRSDRNFRQNMDVLIDLLVTYIKNDEVLFVCFLKELAIEQGVAEEDEQFDFVGILSMIAEQSSDRDIIASPDKDLKIKVLNDALFMGMIRWFNTGKTADGLSSYMQDIVHICLSGILSAKEAQ
jgi:AcrR family transcriptional regulator